jgi:hypothetical protein
VKGVRKVDEQVIPAVNSIINRWEKLDEGINLVGEVTVNTARAVGTATAERVNSIGEAATNRLDSTRLAANRTVANVRRRFNMGGAKNRTRRIKTTI